MELLFALPGVITTCLLVFVLLKVLERQNEERQGHRIEVDQLVSAQREQIERLIGVHRKEVANLCQRIQAPQVAVAQHIPSDLPQDPPQVDLDDDATLREIRKREGDLNLLAQELQNRAEQLAAEV